MLLRFQVNAVHVSIQCVLHCKRAPATRPTAYEVFGASVSCEVLIELVLRHESLRAAWTLEGLVSGVRMNMSDQLIRRRK